MQLTIRSMPNEVEETVRKTAREERISLNKAVIRLLEKAIGLQGPKGSHKVQDDLDRFCGAWKQEEAADMEKILEETRSIDKELWK